ncbi:DUF5060 domain-containing protein [Thalassotalea agariperforans]
MIKPITIQKLLFLTLSFFISQHSLADVAVKQSGELRLWHKTSLTFDGPQTSENDKLNPFIHYRLNVEFVHPATGKSYVIPGFFAADGDAANTSATAGNKWRVNFTPDELGHWTWQADFRKGPYAAVSTIAHPGESAGFMDQQKGAFTVKENNKKLPDLRAKGRLEYINQAYLRFAGNGEYFIKAGPDAPENLLAYADFDGSFHNDGHKDDLVKNWQPHVQDWQKGDPTWQGNKGKGLIGALNYIADQGMNSISFLTLNILGDDQNVFPYVDYSTYDRFDVSKLAQWEIIFAHAQSRGLFLHFKTQEDENQGLLDNGGLGLHRQIYYRELIARFSHHLALNWNMGEENGEWHNKYKSMPQSKIQRLAMAKYFQENDPYHHLVVIHNGLSFDDLLGADSFYTGLSLQTSREDYSLVHPETKRLRTLPTTNGRPFAVSVDEPGHHKFNLPPDSEDPEHNLARMNGLWGAYTAGAWGTEWYFGYAHEHSDLTAQSWRTRELFWQQAKHVLDFFKLSNVPYHKAKNHDEIIINTAGAPANNAWALADIGEFYIVYVKNSQYDVSIKMKPLKGNYSVSWFNPRTGGKLQKGSIDNINIEKEGNIFWGTHNAKLGKPPINDGKDWAILIKKQ